MAFGGGPFGGPGAFFNGCADCAGGCANCALAPGNDDDAAGAPAVDEDGFPVGGGSREGVGIWCGSDVG